MENFKNDLRGLKTTKETELLRVKYLGRKSELAAFFNVLNSLPIEEKKTAGQRANEYRKKITAALEQKTSELKSAEEQKLRLQNKIDVTIPGAKIDIGHLNIITKMINQIEFIFGSMGFEIVEGPEIEDEYHNFDALNIPKNHPARDKWDTFWLRTRTSAGITTRTATDITRTGADISVNSRINQRKPALLLRTHTSPVQIRYMETHNPPFRIVAPGRIYRYEATDASHSHTFYQLEGLVVGKDISLANFKFIIEDFFRKFFSAAKIEFKFVPSYYPFVEPGLDVLMKWGDGWLEVAGAGMVHPNVFQSVGYVKGDWQGFAFGFGIDRLVMIKYEIPDIRLLYSGDLRFIKQF